jgi:hypothetical protein
MTTLIFHGIIIDLLLLCRLPYFSFCLLVIFVSLYLLVLTLKLASELLSLHVYKQEFNWIIIIIISKY